MTDDGWKNQAEGVAQEAEVLLGYPAVPGLIFLDRQFEALLLYRGARAASTPVVFLNRCHQPLLDRGEDATITESPRRALHHLGLWNGVEES